MLPKDFENFELRIKKLREESLEAFEDAEEVFDNNYAELLKNVFPRDVLGVKKYISGYFTLTYVDEIQADRNPDISKIFKQSVIKSLYIVPLSTENRNQLINSILKISDTFLQSESYLLPREDISRDPFFALVEDFSLDGDISKEEFIILKNTYEHQKDFIKSLESLPDETRELFHRHIAQVFSSESHEKKEAFVSEYHHELQGLEKRGLNIEPVVVFVSRMYYKNPGKLKKFEHPKRRLRRTFKLALLRLLRAKLGNIDAAIFLKRFEEGETFEDFFLLLYKLLEVIDENPNGEEVHTLLQAEEETESLVFTAEKTKQKILEGEKITANISNLIGETDSRLEEGLLEKVLDDGTHFHGEEIHFSHEDNMAGIYAESGEEEDDKELEEIIESGDTLRGNYESLKEYFRKVEEEKRNAFLEGNYDSVDAINERLMRIESKIEKIGKLLGEEN